MGYGGLARLRHGRHSLIGKTDIVHVLHRATVGGDIAYAAPAIGSKAALVHGHHRVELGEDTPYRCAVGIEIAIGDRIGAIYRLDAVVDAFPCRLAHRHQIGGCGLLDTPYSVLGIVGVEHTTLQHTATFGRPTRTGLHTERIGGLVGEVVTAGEEGASHHMRVGIEAHTEVIAHVLVEMHATPATTLHITRAGIPHVHRERLSRGNTRSREGECLRTGLRDCLSATVHPEGVDSANKIKADAGTGTQQLKRHHRLAVERRTVTQIEGDIIVLHIHRILHLTLRAENAQQQEYHDGKSLLYPHS